jgi:hypothetical protein
MAILKYGNIYGSVMPSYPSHNAAVEQCPKGICLELLVLPAAERRGNQEFAAQLPHSPRSEAEGGTSYSVVSVYLLYPWGRKVCAHEEVPFLIDYLDS